MDYSPKDTIRLHMGEKTDKELLDIWTKNDRYEYTNKTFIVIHDILLERGVDIPLQKEFIETTDVDASDSMTLSGFFSFRCMISPSIIKIIYILGAIGVTISSIVFMSGQFFWMGIMGVVIGNLVWRLVCETAIIFFRMNEQLGQLVTLQELNEKH